MKPIQSSNKLTLREQRENLPSVQKPPGLVSGSLHISKVFCCYHKHIISSSIVVAVQRVSHMLHIAAKS